MAACIEACAQQSDCVGAGWGNYQGSLTCWLKSYLGRSQGSGQWYFAALDRDPFPSSPSPSPSPA